jgi:hypothetical protein
LEPGIFYGCKGDWLVLVPVLRDTDTLTRLA